MISKEDGQKMFNAGDSLSCTASKLSLLTGCSYDQAFLGVLCFFSAIADPSVDFGHDDKSRKRIARPKGFGHHLRH